MAWHELGICGLQALSITSFIERTSDLLPQDDLDPGQTECHSNAIISGHQLLPTQGTSSLKMFQSKLKFNFNVNFIYYHSNCNRNYKEVFFSTMKTCILWMCKLHIWLYSFKEILAGRCYHNVALYQAWEFQFSAQQSKLPSLTLMVMKPWYSRRNRMISWLLKPKSLFQYKDVFLPV